MIYNCHDCHGRITHKKEDVVVLMLRGKLRYTQDDENGYYCHLIDCILVFAFVLRQLKPTDDPKEHKGTYMLCTSKTDKMKFEFF